MPLVVAESGVSPQDFEVFSASLLRARRHAMPLIAV